MRRVDLNGGGDRDLNPLERRIALMRLAGASVPSIVMATERDETYVYHVLKRERVVHFMNIVTGMMVQEAAPVAASLNNVIQATKGRAFEVEREVMENLFRLTPDGEEVTIRDYIRAQIGAATTAQDILDRAGERAPAQTVNLHAHAVAPQTIDSLTKALSEVMNGPKATAIEGAVAREKITRGYNSAERPGVRDNVERLVEAPQSNDFSGAGRAGDDQWSND